MSLNLFPTEILDLIILYTSYDYNNLYLYDFDSIISVQLVCKKWKDIVHKLINLCKIRRYKDIKLRSKLIPPSEFTYSAYHSMEYKNDKWYKTDYVNIEKIYMINNRDPVKKTITSLKDKPYEIYIWNLDMILTYEKYDINIIDYYYHDFIKWHFSPPESFQEFVEITWYGYNQNISAFKYPIINEDFEKVMYRFRINNTIYDIRYLTPWNTSLIDHGDEHIIKYSWYDLYTG